MILKPVLTEKTIALADKLNQFTFEVTMDANKTEAAKDLAKKFGVTVEAVRVHTRLGQTYSVGRNTRRTGKRADRKVMVFKLKASEKIVQYIRKTKTFLSFRSLRLIFLAA